MINGELSVFLLTCMSPNTNVTHGIKAKLVSFWSFEMYLSFEPKKISFRQSADSQSTKYSVSKLMVDPVVIMRFCILCKTYLINSFANLVIEGLKSNVRFPLQAIIPTSLFSLLDSSNPSKNWLNLSIVESVVSFISSRVSSRNWWANPSVDGRDSNHSFWYIVPSNWKGFKSRLSY